MTEPRPIRFRCMDCRNEFDAPPGPVRGGAIHALPGSGHPASVDGACPTCGSLYVGRLNWYVVATAPRAEPVVAERLRALDHAVLFLHYMVPVKRQDRFSQSRRARGDVEPKLVKRPVMAGYLFVGLTPRPDFYRIATLPGVSSILANEKGSPAELDCREIDRMRRGAKPDGLVETEDQQDGRRPPLEVGSIVRITAGPFAGFEGPVEGDDGRQFIAVRVTMFGHERPVEVPHAGVEVIWKAA